MKFNVVGFIRSIKMNGLDHEFGHTKVPKKKVIPTCNLFGCYNLDHHLAAVTYITVYHHLNYVNGRPKMASLAPFTHLF